MPRVAYFNRANVAMVVLCFLGAQTMATRSRQRLYDGNWWLTVSAAEQSGFLDGLSDCNSFELNARSHYQRSTQENQQYVTNFYEGYPEQIKTSVFDVYVRAENQPSKVQRPGDGEVWDEPHGYYDGMWWNPGIEAETLLRRRGFVEGYLWCYTNKAHSPKGFFSEPPAAYAARIAKWYQDPAHENDKIADVLFRFRHGR